MHGFHYALKSQGYLLLGKSESIGSATDLFEQATKEYKVYTKKAVTTPLHLDFPLRTFKSSFYQLDEEEENLEPAKEIDLEKETEKILLKHYVPASVLVNKDLEILRFRGSVSKYLEPANGKASLNLMKMLKEDIMYEMRTAIHRAKKENRTIRKEGLQLNADGQINELAIEIIPVKGNGKDANFLIIFKESDFSPAVTKPDSPARPAANDNKIRRIETLEKQLTELRENMKIMSEEFEATREELQSANEEVISSNEELQSINEELETSKEELQSTNEELTTINEELQNRNDELQQANDYSQAVVETVHEPLIILNGDLRIQNANRAFYKTFLLSPEETEGNYFYDIAGQQWDIAELRKQLKLLQTKNIEFTNFRTTYSVGKNEKILLLTAQKLSIRGGKSSLILIAMDDITERTLGEERLKANEERFRLLLHNAFDLITIISKDGTVSYEGGSAEKILGYPAGERVGKNIFKDQIVHPDDLPVKKRAFARAIANPNEVVRAEFRLKHKNGSYKNMEAIYVNLLKNPRIEGIIANYHDISERRKLEKQRGEFAGTASSELKKPVEELNEVLKKMQKIFSSSKDEKISQLVKDLHTQLGKLTKTTKNLFD
jgi:two-component system CheB/CheR fusion protein